MKIGKVSFWRLAPCALVGGHKHLEGTRGLQLQGQIQIQ
jgi:hypothetical protein